MESDKFLIYETDKSKLKVRKGIDGMKAIILDMYGVIVKQTGDDFVPYIQQTFPNLSTEEIHKPWDKANIGEWILLKLLK